MFLCMQRMVSDPCPDDLGFPYNVQACSTSRQMTLSARVNDKHSAHLLFSEGETLRERVCMDLERLSRPRCVAATRQAKDSEVRFWKD